MPRRRAVTREQLEVLLALPATETELIRHWTLGAADLAAIERRRGDPNQLGFALQLCAFRYPGRLLRPREAIPELALGFVAGQLGVAQDALATYAVRVQTRREQLGASRAEFGFRTFAPEHRRELRTWLLPVALGNTDAVAIAATLMDELRRRKIIAPGPSVIERLIAAAAVLAERQVAHQLTRDLPPEEAKTLDALLATKEGTAMSKLAWARQPPGAPGHRALARLVEQRAIHRTIGLDPAGAEGVHPERLRKLAREGARFTAQHLRALSPLRRRATLIATVLDTITRLTDDTVALYDRAVGRMFRRAEVREQDALMRDARAINDKVRLLAKLGAALIEARESGTDLQAAVASVIGWDKLARSVEEAKRLARPDKVDLSALAARAWPVLHRLGPLFLGSLQFHAVPAAAATLRAVELLRSIYESGGGRKWPRSLPTSFLRPAWREAVLSPDGAEHRTWEAATLLALRDRLRAGDIWVEGSRQWRAVEDQLIPPALFAAMREAGPLPVAAPATAEEYLAERRALSERRLAEVAAKAAADRLEDVRIKGDELKITPLKAVTPEEAETLANRLYRMMPNLRITSLLAEVDRWTGFSGAFTHLHSGAPADDRRVALTAVLADATNLGLTRMAEACAVASYRQLAWTAAWHLREETYRQALAILVNAQQRQPLAASFGAADVSSSDGQHFPTAGPGEAVGAVNAHYERTATALFYTHLSARQAPYHSVAIPPSGEAAYVIDGLLYHEANLSIGTHHTDGGAVSDHNFALAYLLGFYFAPRRLDLPGLRRQATVELNKGEARNALARAVCFHRLGRLRDRAVEAQQYRASGLALVTAAIALWNTVYLDRALDDLRCSSEMIPEALLAHLAPIGWQHINLTGDYLWDVDVGLAPDGFRALRTTATSLRPAVAA